MMGPVGREKGRTTANEHRGDGRDVRQMSAAPVGIIDQDEVAVLERQSAEGGLDRKRHGSQWTGMCEPCARVSPRRLKTAQE